MQTLIIHTETEKLNALVALLKAFDVSFEIKKTKEKPYNPEFVANILERRENARKGNIVEYTDDLRKELFGK